MKTKHWPMKLGDEETPFFPHSTVGNGKHCYSMKLICVMLPCPKDEHFITVLPTPGRKEGYFYEELLAPSADSMEYNTHIGSLIIHNGRNMEITWGLWDAEFI